MQASLQMVTDEQHVFTCKHFDYGGGFVKYMVTSSDAVMRSMYNCGTRLEIYCDCNVYVLITLKKSLFESVQLCFSVYVLNGQRHLDFVSKEVNLSASGVYISTSPRLLLYSSVELLKFSHFFLYKYEN